MIIVLLEIELKSFFDTSIDFLLYPEIICGSFGSSISAFPCNILSGQ